MRHLYRQKSQLIYDLLASMANKKTMLNNMCLLVNLDNVRLHKYLNALIEKGLVDKYKIIGTYDNKLYEYKLTEDGQHTLELLREYNALFRWIFEI